MTLSVYIEGLECVENGLKFLSELMYFSELWYFLRVSLECKWNMVFFNQVQYYNCIFKQFGMDFSRSASTPMVQNINSLFLKEVGSDEIHVEASNYHYRSLVGSMHSLSAHIRAYLAFCGISFEQGYETWVYITLHGSITSSVVSPRNYVN